MSIVGPVWWKRWGRLVLMAGAMAVLGTGCAALGYRLGSSLPPGINVAYVPTLLNRTAEPMLELTATQALISELQREGTLSVGDMEKADVILTVVLEGFALAPLRYDSDTSTATSEYRMTIRASVELTRRLDNQVLVQNTVAGETDFILTGDMTSAKRDALPAATADLAQRIVQSVVEFW